MIRGCHRVSPGNGSGLRYRIRVSFGALSKSRRTGEGYGEFMCVFVLFMPRFRQYVGASRMSWSEPGNGTGLRYRIRVSFGAVGKGNRTGRDAW